MHWNLFYLLLSYTSASIVSIRFESVICMTDPCWESLFFFFLCILVYTIYHSIRHLHLRVRFTLLRLFRLQNRSFDCFQTQNDANFATSTYYCTDQHEFYRPIWLTGEVRSYAIGFLRSLPCTSHLSVPLVP